MQKQIVKTGYVRTSRTENRNLLHIPEMKQKATVGYSVEAIVKSS